MTTQQWEYRLEAVSAPDADDADDARSGAAALLDALGAEGWEAVGFAPSRAAGHGLRVETNRYMVLLKRRCA